MKAFLPIVFASIAAVGNAIFALAQSKNAGAAGSLVFVSLSVLVAAVFGFLAAFIFGEFNAVAVFKQHYKAVFLSGFGLFLVYVGFNLLYSSGVSSYILYAVISIFTTTIIVGILWLGEPISVQKIAAIILALASVVLFLV
ncbi:MAG: hypothetical protein ACTTIC_05780 [Helicobacteraceae bacterium]